MRYIPGPDFPTAGLINGARGIREAYETGRGRVQMRAKTAIETDDVRNRQAIIVTESVSYPHLDVYKRQALRRTSLAPTGLTGSCQSDCGSTPRRISPG